MKAHFPTRQNCTSIRCKISACIKWIKIAAYKYHLLIAMTEVQESEA
ncbi:MAG: hypothetical protein SPI72_01595 [Porphyromonas sp.]|nr:hypothetical protein [Porphyromonas sp.]